jgi:arginine decarboxylase
VTTQAKILFASGEEPSGSGAIAEQLRRIQAELEEDDLDVRWAKPQDALAVIGADATLTGALVDWGSPKPDCEAVLRGLADRFRRLPVLLIVRGSDLSDVPLWVYEIIHGFIWPLEDTPSFIAGRIVRSVRDYQEWMLPPFFRALRRFDDRHEYSWHTPAHAGGVAFLKSPVGRAYFDYYGERLLRTDLSISVAELGSPLEHTGPIGEAERNAARIFGAERTFFVLNGNSTANRIVGHHSIARDELVLIDRNCHQSVQHALTLTGARPVYVVPERNRLGLAGPVPPAALAQAAIGDRIAGSPLAREAAGSAPTYAVITNSTYDGLCYDAGRVADLLSGSVPRMHFDEAWFAYARFHPLYRCRYGMSVGPETIPDSRRPTVFVTQSTHKLLAALSQGAMLHVRSAPRAPVDYERFNATAQMHGSTSPNYPMIASLDVAAGMMDGPAGRFLTDEAIVEAIRFRQAMVRLGARVRESGDRPGWFFGVWQPPTVTDPSTGAAVPFEDASIDLLRGEPDCWRLEPGAAWHGFSGLEPGYCLLDPIKVTITCPGAEPGGPGDPGDPGGPDDPDGPGIPAKLLAAYLADRNIVVEKTGDYTVLVLFSMGITKGKWGTLADALMDFKSHYDGGSAVQDVISSLDRPGLSLRELCDRMHRTLLDARLGELLDEVFTSLPEPVMPPAECYQRFIRAGTELVRLADMGGRISASVVAVTPPGIPVLMPGEAAGAADGPLLTYLSALEAYDKLFPDLATELHGVHRDENGDYWIECVRT